MVVDDAAKACTPVASIVANLTSELTPIALVPRGGCYFVEKAHHAQEAGAAAVIISDDVDEPLITMAGPQRRDGRYEDLAKNVTVPTVLVSQLSGATLTAFHANATAAGGEVTLEVDFTQSITNPDARVEYELWGTASDSCGGACATLGALRSGFATTARSFEESNATQFEPFFILDDTCHQVRRRLARSPAAHRRRSRA